MNKTTDYMMFTIKSGNRGLDSKHINKLKESIQKHGFLESCPIIINEHNEVIDGQHRLQACRELGLPVPYIVEKGDSNELLIDLNVLQKKWNMKDYIKFFALERKNENYVRLYTLMNEIPLDPTSILNMATTSQVGGEYTRKVREGELILNGLEVHQARVTYSNICMLRDAIHITINGRLVRAIIILMNIPNFSWSMLLHKAEKYRVKAYQCTSIQEWINMLTYLYNYNNKVNRIEL